MLLILAHVLLVAFCATAFPPLLLLLAAYWCWWWWRTGIHETQGQQAALNATAMPRAAAKSERPRMSPARRATRIYAKDDELSEVLSQLDRH
jgi:hypothetical protein